MTAVLHAPELYRVYDPSTDEFAPDGYPAEWHRIIKHDVRARAGNRCVRCGHPYLAGENPMEAIPGGKVSWSACDDHCVHAGDVRVKAPNDVGWIEVTLSTPDSIPKMLEHDIEVQAAWRILTVHHLDGMKANCRWWNLVSLCQRCHLQVQRKVQMNRVWPWEHSSWFAPYVAGYYAFVYLNEEIGFAEALARKDELLALERMA